MDTAVRLLDMGAAREATSTCPPSFSARDLRMQVERVNKELWLVLSLFVIAALLRYFDPTLFGVNLGMAGRAEWLEITVWGGTLIVTGYLRGTLYEHKDVQVAELRETYNGILMLLRHFISKNKYTENHSCRVSVYATKIAAQLKLHSERIEDIRSAARLHDIGKLDISKSILYKAARLTADEVTEMQTHVDRGMAMPEPVGESLRRILPIILSHHDKLDGSGYHKRHGEKIPIEARVISVADVFDSLTSDRPYRKAVSPFEVREILVKKSGSEFDPKVVDAFLVAFKKGEMEVPSLVV